MLAERSTTIEGDCDECIEIFSCLKNVEEFVKEKGDDDMIYDVSVAIEDIKTYIKHQVRDAQQKLAKVLAFQSIDEETAFWLKDYCQKVLPTKYRKGQKEYFGKKGMSLHVDILCMKKDGVFVKKVYFTAIYQCEQGLSDSLCLADVVLDKMKVDFPSLKNVYAKSDNASSYHGNYYLRALYKLCEKKGLSLKRYDYNEPCRGKINVIENQLGQSV